MKILFLSPACDIHTCRWVNELSRKGHEVHLVFCKNHVSKIQRISDKVFQHELKINSGIGYYLNSLSLKKIYKNIKPDVVNVHYASGYGTLARISGIRPYVLSVWGSDVYDFPYNSKYSMKVIRKNLNSAERISSTSNVMAKQVEKLIEVKKEIAVTPFGVDTERFKKVKVDKDNQIIIGTVKKLKKKYGMEYLILSFGMLLERLTRENKFELIEKLSLEIYGEGEEQSSLEELIVKNNLEKKVFLKGVVENSKLPHVLSSMDIFAVSSILDSESFGVSVVEAMSTELPVIASDVDGFKEVIDNNENGIIVPRKNIQEMSSAMYDLIMDEQKRTNIGINARKKVMNEYNFSNNVDAMLDVYNEIIKN